MAALDTVRTFRGPYGDWLFKKERLGGFGSSLAFDNREDEWAVCESIRRSGRLDSANDWCGYIEFHDVCNGGQAYAERAADRQLRDFVRKPTRAECLQLEFEEQQAKRQREKEALAAKEWKEAERRQREKETLAQEAERLRQEQTISDRCATQTRRGYLEIIGYLQNDKDRVIAAAEKIDPRRAVRVREWYEEVANTPASELIAKTDRLIKEISELVN